MRNTYPSNFHFQVHCVEMVRCLPIMAIITKRSRISTDFFGSTGSTVFEHSLCDMAFLVQIQASGKQLLVPSLFDAATFVPNTRFCRMLL